MFCPRCGYNNDDSAQYCQKCGEALTIQGKIRNNAARSQSGGENSSNNNNRLIIAGTVIIILLMILATMFFVLNINLPFGGDSSTGNAGEVVSNNVSQSAPSEASSVDNSMKILGGSFETASPLPAKTFVTINVGRQHAGEKCKIKVIYTNGGTQLNQGNIVPFTVDDSGCFTMNTLYPVYKYPDHAFVILYDGDENVIDTRDVNMQPSSGTQTFS